MNNENSFCQLINSSKNSDVLNPDKLFEKMNSNYLDDILKIQPILIIERSTGNNTGSYLKKLIYQDTHNSVYVLEWDSLQATPPHNHYFNKKNTFCYFYVLAGEFVETVFDKYIQHIQTNIYVQGSFAKIDKADYVHILKNNTSTKSYTLHIYPE